MANLWAFWWSLCSACSASASPTKAAAASTPAWCIPLPRAFRRCQASSMKCLGPPIRVSAGAPRPWEEERRVLPAGPRGASLSLGVGEGCVKGTGKHTHWPYLERGYRGPGPVAASKGTQEPNSASCCGHPHPPVSGGAAQQPSHLGETETQSRSAPRSRQGARAEPPRRSAAGVRPGGRGPHGSGPGGAPGAKCRQWSEGPGSEQGQRVVLPKATSPAPGRATGGCSQESWLVTDMATWDLGNRLCCGAWVLSSVVGTEDKRFLTFMMGSLWASAHCGPSRKHVIWFELHHSSVREMSSGPFHRQGLGLER